MTAVGREGPGVHCVLADSALACLFDPPFERELVQVERAADYYARCMQALLASEHRAAIARYYAVGPGTSAAMLRFKALFFATRLQPVLDFVALFAREQGRAPRLLDIGCGYGLETSLLAAAGAEVQGMDFVTAKIDGARAIGSLLCGIAGAASVPPYEQGDVRNAGAGDFDAIYSSATLHHIEPVDAACRAIARLLRERGVFFLSDENGASPAQQLIVQNAIGWRSRRVLERSDPATGATTLYGNENIRPVFRWTRLFRAAGLTRVGLKYCRFLPPSGLGLRPTLALERGLRRVPGLRELTAIGFVAAFRKAHRASQEDAAC